MYVFPFSCEKNCEWIKFINEEIDIQEKKEFSKMQREQEMHCQSKVTYRLRKLGRKKNSKRQGGNKIKK